MAEELTEKVLLGRAVTVDELVRMKQLLALDLIRSTRPTCRARGYELLQASEESTEEQARRDLGLA